MDENTIDLYSDQDSGLDTGGLNTARSTINNATDSMCKDGVVEDENPILNHDGNKGSEEMNNNQIPKVIINDAAQPDAEDNDFGNIDVDDNDDNNNIDNDETIEDTAGVGDRIEPDGIDTGDNLEVRQENNDSNLATDGSNGDDNSEVSFDGRMNDFMGGVDAAQLDENNWRAVMKAMDYHYKTQLSLQTEEHLHKMHDLKLQLEEQLTLRHCEMQQRLASHQNNMHGDDETNQDGGVASSPDVTDYYSPQSDHHGLTSTKQDSLYHSYTTTTTTKHPYTDDYYKDGRVKYANIEGFANLQEERYTSGKGYDQDVIHLPEIGVYHVQQQSPFMAQRYKLDTPVMKALNYKMRQQRTQDSGFTDEMSTGRKVKTRSVFAGKDPAHIYDVINSPTRLFPSPDLERSPTTSGGADSSSDFLDLPELMVSSTFTGNNMAEPGGSGCGGDDDVTDGERSSAGVANAEQRQRPTTADNDVINENDVSLTEYKMAAAVDRKAEEDQAIGDGSLLRGKEFTGSPNENGSFRTRWADRDKYARHLADMKRYYEAEIHALREELTQTREAHLTALSMTSRDVAARDADHVALRSRCELLEEQSKTLSTRVDQLETALTDSQRECNKKQRQISRLDCEMDNAERRVTLYMEDAQKLMEEHEKLRKEHRSLQLSLSSAENQLYESRNELTDHKGLISRLELDRLRLERENEQLREKRQQNDSIPEDRPYRLNQSATAVSRSLSRSATASRSINKSALLTRSYSQSDARPVDQSADRIVRTSRSHACRPMAVAEGDDVTIAREPIRSQIANRRQSMPTRTNRNQEFSSNHLTVPQLNQNKVTPTNIAPPNEEVVANAPVAKQRRARQAFGKSPRKSLSEEFRQSISLDQTEEDDSPEYVGRPRPKLQKTDVRYDETNLDDSPTDGANDTRTPAANQRLPGRLDLAELERQLDTLTMDKRTVETALSHIPIRTTRPERLEKERLDQRLDEIHAALGAVRMQLKKYLVLKTSR